MAHVPSVVQQPLRYLLHPAAVILAAIGYSALVYYFDTRWRFLPYNIAATFVLASIFFLTSRRPFFSFYGAALLALFLTLVSLVKFQFKGIALHIYDFIFTGSDGSIISFLLTYYFSLVATAVLALVAIFILLTTLFLLEKPARFNVAVRVPVVVLGIIAAVIAYQPTKRDADFLPFIGGYNASAFFLSLWHVPSLVKRLPLAEKIEHIKIDKPFADTVNCTANSKKPDFFLVLSESQTSPLVLPQLSIPAKDVDTFRSGDGKIKPLFVEIFGGGTWMTNFSVLTGLSSADLGWQGPYVNQLLEGKVKGGLPEVLSRCGYRTVAIMPMAYHSVNEGPFLNSLGFQEIYDSGAMNMPVMGIRDANYFDYAEQLIAKHRKEDKRPLFLLVQTMFTHSPYDHALLQDEATPPHVYAENPQANEYMRRVSASRSDLMRYVEQRRRTPGDDGSVFAEFGDHQSVATRDYVLDRISDDSPFTDFRSAVYETFYSVHGFGVDIDYSQLGQVEDVPFLTARLLAAAKLPTSPVFEDLRRLSDVCRGKFHTCDNRQEVDAHLKKRVDAGLLALD
ncbi:MAG: putative cyclic beta,2-glucan modification protein [Rhizobium sp.]|nr:putative cyclic beta,2-glucan modification protein [Rhizobium sp.]